MRNDRFIYDNIYTFSERKQLIAETLQLIRKSKRFTQKYVAEQIGINTQTYATYERGRNEPPAEIIVRLSYLYDIPTDLLLQKDNVSKEKSQVIKQLDSFDNAIDELKGKIISGDAETRNEIAKLTNRMEKMIDNLRIINEKDNESSS